MICKECGKEIMPGTLFCANCGAKGEATVQVADDDRTVVLWDEEPQAPKQDDDRTVVLWDEEPQAPKQDDDRTVVLWDEEPQAPKQDDDRTVVLWDDEPQQPAKGSDIPKICPNCGTKNEGDVAFCVECGAMMSEVKQKPATPPVAPTPVMQTASQPFVSNPTAPFASQLGQSTVEQAKTKKEKTPKLQGERGRIKKLLMMIAAVVVVVIIGAVFVFGGSSSKSVENDLLYLKDNGIYRAQGGSFKPQLITDSFYDDEDDANYYGGHYSPIQYTDDGKYMFYKQDVDGGEFDLYYKKAGSKEEGTKLESGISSYIAYSTDLIVYEKGDKLYLANLKEKQKLASDIGNYWVSGNKQYVCWYEYDKDTTLYIQDVKLKKDKVKIKDVSYLVSASKDLKEIYYRSEDTLYLMKNLEEKVKISSDVSGTWRLGEEGKQKIYYIKEKDRKVYTFDKLVKDDVDRSSEYYGYEDYVLEDLKYQEISIPEYEVYAYSASGDKSEEVVGFNGWIKDDCYDDTDSAEMMLFYSDVDIKNIEKLKLSDIIENYYDNYTDVDIYDTFEYHILKQSNFYLMTSDNQIPVPGMGEFYEKPGEVIPQDYSINSHTKEVYMSVYCKNEKKDSTYDLYAFPYAEKEAEWYLICNDVYNGYKTNSEQGIYYVADVDKDGEEGTLFLNGTEIAEDVYPRYFRTFEKTIYYLKDINSDQNEGTLYINKNGKETKIAEDVARGYYEVIKDGNIAYLVDYNFKKYRGDLFVFTGRKSIAVDTDVTAILK